MFIPLELKDISEFDVNPEFWTEGFHVFQVLEYKSVSAIVNWYKVWMSLYPMLISNDSDKEEQKDVENYNDECENEN